MTMPQTPRCGNPQNERNSEFWQRFSRLCRDPAELHHRTPSLNISNRIILNLRAEICRERMALPPLDQHPVLGLANRRRHRGR